MKKALFWSLLWITLALLFGVYVGLSRGHEAAINFYTGYLIEKSLSIDNLFIFMLIFKTFHIPESQQRKALNYGLIGAVVMRGLFIWLGIELVTRFHFVVYIFGAFLIYSGIRFVFQQERKIPSEFLSKLKVSPFILTILTIEAADLIFAIDSIPAILAITYDPFIVYTSNIFAILGLRAHYFVLKSLLKELKYLHVAISVILILTGLKMVLSDLIEIPNLLMLLLIFLTVIVATAFQSPASPRGGSSA